MPITKRINLLLSNPERKKHSHEELKELEGASHNLKLIQDELRRIDIDIRDNEKLMRLNYDMQVLHKEDTAIYESKPNYLHPSTKKI